ncbi:schlafen family member 13-like [Amblyraja radiata]|uniref:schlafen family member 13-like n=1 Tax=Amblyraja radiata TaxID=386614 RepID=UPI001403F9A0|nr:schlafen family member 13-like [Amblyraja radiata]
MALENSRPMKTSYPDLVLDAGTADFGETHRKKMKDHSLKKQQCRNIVIAACALLNSGGGIIHVKVGNKGYNKITDAIGLDIEQGISNLVKKPSFLEFMQQGSTMWIFVQSWTNSIDEGWNLPRLCSIASNVYCRTGTQRIELNPLEVEDLFRDKLTRSQSSDEEDSDSSNSLAAKKSYLIPKCGNSDMLNQKEFQYGDVINFGESEHVEFKAFSGKNTSERINEAIPALMSSFANANGWFIFVGVTDSREVVGCSLEEPDSFISNIMKRKLKIVHKCSSPRDIDYRLNVASVMKGSGVVGSLIILYVKQSCCVVFADNPDSWTVDDDHVKRMEYTKWAKMLLAKDPEMEKLCMNFENELSVAASPPRCKPVFSVGGDDSLDKMVQRFYKDDYKSFCGIKTFPETVCKELFRGHPGLESLLPGMKPGGRKGILIFSRSWAVDINLRKHNDVICDALLLATGGAPLLYTVVTKEDDAITEHSRNTAMSIKQKLVNVGGYAGKLCVIPKILHYVDPEMAKRGNASSQQQTEHVLQFRYPPSYEDLTKDDITKLLKAVTIVLLHFTSVLSDKIGSEFLNLLSFQQFQILHSKHDIEKCKKLFIHGLPGTGKTVMAEHLVRRIMNTFHCTRDEVLYICENRPLQIFMSQRLKSMCVTRKMFMKGEFPNVKHIVVDEAQNFRNEDGGWYNKAQALRTNKETHPNGPGVFWIFMDQFQTSHVFKTGLPGIDFQDPKEELTIVVRNAKKIHNVVLEHINKSLKSRIEGSRFLEKLAQSTKCNHSFAGEAEINNEMTQMEIVNKIAEQIQSYFKEGYAREDIAILCRTSKECEWYHDSLEAKLKTQILKADKILENAIVLDSLRRFSGLERTIVFAINPVPHPAQSVLTSNIVVCVASRARTKLHIFYEVPFLTVQNN